MASSPTALPSGGLSSAPLPPVDLDESLSKEELQARLDEVNDLLALHQADPVAARELWKAMAPSCAPGGASASTTGLPPVASSPQSGTASPAMGATQTSSASHLAAVRDSVRRRREEIGAVQRASASVTGIFAEAATDVRKHRLRRGSSYPQRLLLSLDATVASCSAVELQRRAEAVAHETRRMQSDVRRWRAEMDRTTVEDVEATRELHMLEGELHEAQLEDLRERAAGMEQHAQLLHQKHAVLLRHATRVLGPETLEAEVPPVMTADDLQAQLKRTKDDIREERYQLAQRRQQRQRLLQRAERKVAALEEQLAEKQRKAVADAEAALSSEADRTAALRAKHAKRAAAIATKALADVVEAEAAQRAEIERACRAEVKVIKADAQVALLARQTAANANGLGPAVAAGPAFSLPGGDSIAKRGTRGRGARR